MNIIRMAAHHAQIPKSLFWTFAEEQSSEPHQTDPKCFVVSNDCLIANFQPAMPALLWQMLEHCNASLALPTFGGSSVIFTPFCSTATGKCGAGMDVNHSLKSGCSSPAMAAAMDKPSTRASKRGIHDLAR